MKLSIPKKSPTADGIVNSCKKNGYTFDSLSVEDIATKSRSYNPFLFVTEKIKNINEEELRDILSIDGFGKEYAKKRLSDMSFLDDNQEWKEKVTKILKEYT